MSFWMRLQKKDQGPQGSWSFSRCSVRFVLDDKTGSQNNNQQDVQNQHNCSGSISVTDTAHRLSLLSAFLGLCYAASGHREWTSTQTRKVYMTETSPLQDNVPVPFYPRKNTIKAVGAGFPCPTAIFLPCILLMPLPSKPPHTLFLCRHRIGSPTWR